MSRDDLKSRGTRGAGSSSSSHATHLPNFVTRTWAPLLTAVLKKRSRYGTSVRGVQREIERLFSTEFVNLSCMRLAVNATLVNVWWGIRFTRQAREWVLHLVPYGQYSDQLNERIADKFDFKLLNYHSQTFETYDSLFCFSCLSTRDNTVWQYLTTAGTNFSYKPRTPNWYYYYVTMHTPFI